MLELAEENLGYFVSFSMGERTGQVCIFVHFCFYANLRAVDTREIPFGLPFLMLQKALDQPMP